MKIIKKIVLVVCLITSFGYNNFANENNTYIKFIDTEFEEFEKLEEKNYYIIGDRYLKEFDKYDVLTNNLDEINEDYIISDKVFSFEVDDSLEPFNRRVYDFNTKLDKHVIYPATETYKKVIPRPIRSGISNFYGNFKEIPTFVNSLLQLKGKKAVNSLGRFVVNSTLGVAGISDVAEKMGMKKDYESMGETLGTYGVGPGSYFVMPVLGPSSVRDTLGFGMDMAMETGARFVSFENPVLYKNGVKTYHYIPVRQVVKGLNLSSEANVRYGSLSSPFEYDVLKIFYTNLAKIKIKQ